MGDEGGQRRGAVIALVAALCLVAANMRPTITAVGPLLEQIGADTGMAVATLGLLTSVPLIAWGLVSPLAHGLGRRFGMSRVVLWSLILLAAGTAVRSLPGPAVGLWLGTVLIGVALAVVNVLMPAAVKRDFPGRVPVMMSVYTALLGGVGALASGVAVPISQLVDDEADGWRVSLLVTGGALLPFAILAWGWAHRGTHPVLRGAPRVRHRRTGIWTDAVAWQVAGYMAFQSATFYMVVTWLATISTSIGRSPVVAGFDVMIYQLFSLAGSLVLPLALRGRAERFIPAVIPVLGIAATVGLMLAPQSVLLWAVIMGLFSGSSLAMALTLIAQRARDHEGSSALSGMSQSVGYLFAAIGPVAFGWLHATVGGWVASLGLLLFVMVGQALTGLLAGRERYVLEGR